MREQADDEEYTCHVKNIPLPAAERTRLNARTESLDVAKDLGKFRVVTAHTPKMMQGGYWCTVCECLLKDSLTWVDHVNGRKHNRALGMTMQVPVKDTNDVKARIAALKRGSSVPVDDDDAIEARIKEVQEDEAERKRKKREKKKRKLAEEAADLAPKVKDKEAKMLAAMGLPTGFG